MRQSLEQSLSAGDTEGCQTLACRHGRAFATLMGAPEETLSKLANLGSGV